MRAPMISPKKCFVVKVDGSEGEVDRERQQSPSRDVGDEMDTGENIISDLQRPEDIQPSRVVVEHGTEDGVEMLGTSLGTGRSGQGNFYETFKEINLALDAFDKADTINLQPREVSSVAFQSGDTIKGMGLVAEGHSVLAQGVQRVSMVVESCTSSAGSLRGWKRLARETDVVVQVGSSSAGKRSVDEFLEGWKIWYQLNDDVLA